MMQKTLGLFSLEGYSDGHDFRCSQAVLLGSFCPGVYSCVDLQRILAVFSLSRL